MKKIISLLIVLFLLSTNMIFATEEQGSLEPSPQSERIEGLYFYTKNYGHDTYDYLSDIHVSLGTWVKGDFYFYNGTDYEKINLGSLIPSDNIQLGLKEDHDSPQSETTMKVSVTPSKTGNGTISYVKDDNTYSVNVHASFPGYGLYTSNSKSDETFVRGLYDYKENQEFYVIDYNGNILTDRIIAVGYYSGPSDFIEVPFNINLETGAMSWSHRNEGSYCIKIKNTEGSSPAEMIFSVNNNRDLAAIVYGDDYVTFGIAMANDQNNLFITNGYGDYTKDHQKTVTFVLAAGMLYGPSAIVADSEVYDSISDVSYSVNAIGMSEDEYSVSISNEKISAFERNVYPVTITFEPHVKGKLELIISFYLEMPNGQTKKINTYQYFTLKEEKKYELSLTASDDIQTILSSYDNLKSHFNTYDFVDVNSIKVLLPDGGSYNGTLDINMADYNIYNGKIFELICIGETKYTINGGVDITGGYVTLSGIKFNSTADGENDVAVKATAPENGHSVGYVYNCEFDNYEYAVRSIDTGTIFGINSNIFRNCKYGYYIDCHNKDTSMSGANSQYNKFINCTNAIVMMSAPSNAPMFSWRFINNEFYNDNVNSYDFVVGEDNGVLYCQENYYGLKENEVSNASNLRSARVNYTSTTNTQVVTNPCIRYYYSDFRLGIDPADGLYTRIFSGRASKINSADLKNLKEVGITGNDGQELIGKLNFGE